jgi:dihydroneopterin aldolase
MIPHPLFGPAPAADSLHTLYLRRLRCQAAIGVYASEQGRRQPIEVNLVVQVQPPAEPLADELRQVLDYTLLRRGVLDLIAAAHYRLQETLAEAIAAHCLAQQGVQAVYVSIGKLEAFDDCEAVGCELIRQRAGR